MAGSKSGYRSVACRPDKPKPYDAQVKRGGKLKFLGSFATAEEAALHAARARAGKPVAAAAAAGSLEGSAEQEPALKRAKGGTDSSEALIDKKLWPGAATAGWTLKQGNNYTWTYISPDGRKFSNRRTAQTEVTAGPAADDQPASKRACFVWQRGQSAISSVPQLTAHGPRPAAAWLLAALHTPEERLSHSDHRGSARCSRPVPQPPMSPTFDHLSRCGQPSCTSASRRPSAPWA